MDEKLIVALFDQVLDRQFSVDRALALFGQVEGKDEREWRIRPKAELKGVQEVLFRFFDPARRAPEDVDLVLATPWSITTTRLAVLFGGAVSWDPPGPSPTRRRMVSIIRRPRGSRRSGMAQFEIDHIGDEIEDLKVIMIRYRPVGE
jgi:hypothetical protein